MTTVKTLFVTTVLTLLYSIHLMEAASNSKQASIKYAAHTTAAATGGQHARTTRSDHFGSKHILLTFDRSQHEDEVKPNRMNSRFYSPVACENASFPIIKNRRSLRKHNHRVSRMADPSSCDRGIFPLMCDFNKSRLPQMIDMVDCGRCNSDGNQSNTAMCLTVGNKTGKWVNRTLKIDLPFKIAHGQYQMRKQVITVGCYCKPDPSLN